MENQTPELLLDADVLEEFKPKKPAPKKISHEAGDGFFESQTVVIPKDLLNG